jgi:[ribosomal protein S18]-alanine N-acetyltransferase
MPRAPQVHLRPMTPADLERVQAIDRQSFPTPWPEKAFRFELSRNSICWVAEILDSDGGVRLVGSMVIWQAQNRAHIATLAVRPGMRRQGIGTRLLARGLMEARQQGASAATLEVRETNTAAQDLYRSFGFAVVGRNPGYYKDTGEDAILMRLDALDAARLAAQIEPESD